MRKHIHTLILITAILSVTSVCIYRISFEITNYHRIFFHLSYSLLMCLFSWDKIISSTHRIYKGIYRVVIVTFGFAFFYILFLLFFEFENYNSKIESKLWSFFSVGLVIIFLLHLKFRKR
jgi:hypothetical protein